jgi:hypothetical protein
MRLRLPAAVAAALVLAGCTQQQATSTSEYKGEEKDVAEVVADLSDDASRGRGSHVCGEVVTPRLQKLIADGSSCPSEVKKAFEDADTADLAVDDVTVTGTKATAQVSTEARGDEVKRTFRLVKVAGDWRIDSFG